MIQDFAQKAYRNYLGSVDLNKAPFSFLYKLYAHIFLLNKKIPPFFNLEPTNHCNLACSICPSTKSSREKGFIPLELVKKITAEVSRHGSRSFFLFKDGEPFLHPSLFDIIRIIKNAHKRNKIYISTNGQLVDAKCVKNLIDYKVDNINFSIDNATEQGYHAIRGASLEAVEGAVKALIKAKKRVGSSLPHIALHFVICEENKHEVESFKAKWKEKPVTLKFMYFNSWAGFFPQAEQFDGLKRYPCFSLWMFPSVNWDGKISICCVDWNQQEVIGDLHEQSFEQIWNSEKIKEYRRYHLQGAYHKIGLCEKCNIWASRPNFLFTR